MNNKLIKFVAAGAMITGSFAAFAGAPDMPAQAADNGVVPYVELHGGLGIIGGPDSSIFNTGGNIGGAVGASINNNFRAELEFTYYNNSADSYTVNYNSLSFTVGGGTLHNYTTMVNGYYDIDTGSSLTPFITVSPWAKAATTDRTGYSSIIEAARAGSTSIPFRLGENFARKSATGSPPTSRSFS